jgi:hypothetical protein
LSGLCGQKALQGGEKQERKDADHGVESISV